jgi:TPR repeat protein
MWPSVTKDGLGVPKNAEQTDSWLRKAADQGFVPAQCELGFNLFKNGQPQDAAEAVAWSRKAAEQGYAPAQYFVGLSYAKGFGVLSQRRFAGSRGRP